MESLTFVAEIGTNFFGSIDIAKYLIDKAKESGATHCKFQLWKADDLYDKSWKWYKHAKLCELDYDTARILKDYADGIGIGWFASVNTKEDIDFLVDIKAPFIKIKGSQWDNYKLREYVETKNIDVITSFPGWAEFQIRKGKIIYTKLKYPSKFKDINFSCLEDKECSGFSDHTQGIQASLCAAMYPNITIFERHFTGLIIDGYGLDEWETPDWCVSLYPDKFKEMVEKIRHIKGE